MKRQVLYAPVAVLLFGLLVAFPGCKKAQGSAQAIRYGQFDSIEVQHQLLVGEGARVSAPTQMPTATAAFVVDSAGVNVILDVRDAGTPVFSIKDGGAVSKLSGGLSTNLVIAGPTAVATATPVYYQNNAADNNDSFVIAKDATPVVKVGNTGQATLKAGLVLGGKQQLDCTYVEELANTNETLTVAASCYIVYVDTSKNADYTLATTNAVTGTLLYVDQIGPGTLVITDTNVLTSDGNAVSLGANDASLWLFDGSKWQEMLKLAGS